MPEWLAVVPYDWPLLIECELPDEAARARAEALEESLGASVLVIETRHVHAFKVETVGLDLADVLAPEGAP